MRAWPDSLDAPVAAPEHHSIIFENDHVRVLDARVARGETVPLHTLHRPGVQHIDSLADCVRGDVDGNVLVDPRTIDLPSERPLFLWSEPISLHTLENVGDCDIHAIVIELKDGRSH